MGALFRTPVAAMPVPSYPVQTAAAGDVRTFGDDIKYESLGTGEKAKNSEWDNITRNRDGEAEYWKKLTATDRPAV